MADNASETLGHRVSAEARIAGDEGLHNVSILLHEHVEHDFRPERLDDLLEKPNSFLDVTDLASDAPKLLAKDALIWLRTPVPQRELSVDDLFATHRTISVRLRDGSTIAGYVLYSIGNPDAPLGEFMNSQGHYFEVVQEGQIYFVHKKYVAWIDEVKEGVRHA